jgi:hypothetical protein
MKLPIIIYLVALLLSLPAYSQEGNVNLDISGNELKFTMQSSEQVKELYTVIGECEMGRYEFSLNIAGQKVKTKHKVIGMRGDKCSYRTSFKCEDKTCISKCRYPQDALELFKQRTRDDSDIEMVLDPASPEGYRLVNETDQKILAMSKKYCEESKW